ncbi:MAG: glycine--tRNA ligase subunit beta [Candidatus Eisenbacteria bacterium]
MSHPRADFLLELGVEELPTTYIAPALAQLAGELREAIAEMRLPLGDVVTFSTPRRLAVLVTDLVTRQDDYEEEATGPPAAAAWDKEGKPTKALSGFVAGKGAAIEDVRRVKTPKGEYVAVTVKRTGRVAAELLPPVITRIVSGLSFPKSMRWIPGSDFRSARPIRWVVALLGEEVLPLEIAGLAAGRQSRGHRFLHPGAVPIPYPRSYVEALALAGVVADPRLRQQVIVEQAEALARAAGGRLVDDPELIDINNDLVERPQALIGRFDAQFLELPREVIVTALREHQRYFAVETADGELLPAFVGVRNGDDRNLAGVTAGNEAVLRARLEDARFYWDTDLKKSPADRVSELGGIVWLADMGSVRDKAGRMKELGAWIAGHWDADLIGTVERAAMLCKTDLLSEMIGSGKEYASLEGVMGAYYAARHGEEHAVVVAIRDHVRPRGASDDLPTSAAGAALSIADRADTVAGAFLAGKIPSGSEDPYGVRRAANGVVRVLLDSGRALDLSLLTREALAVFARGRQATAPEGIEAKLAEFWAGRLTNALGERGYAYDEVAAALGGSEGGSDPTDVAKRAAALKAWRANVDFVPLVIGFKRVANILRAADDAPGGVVGDLPDSNEAALSEAVVRASREAEPRFAARDYEKVLGVLLSLRAPIDTFFEQVMVNAEDPVVRRRRLGLLATTRALFDRGWDLSKVVVEG